MELQWKSQKVVFNADPILLKLLQLYFFISNNFMKESTFHDVEELAQTILDQAGLPINFKHAIKEPHIDRALGCVFAAIIGDALGSHVEFKPPSSPTTMDRLMQMPGGGTYNTYPGQGTDDTELAMCLLNSLTFYDPNETLKQQSWMIEFSIVNSYIGWAHSHPFDMGTTTRNGIKAMAKFIQPLTATVKSREEVVRKMSEGQLEVFMVNQKSVSNGFLMRNHPLGIFKALMKKFKPRESEDVDGIFNADIKCTHANPVCLEVGREMIDIISELMNRENFSDIRHIFEKYMLEGRLTSEWKAMVIKKQVMPATKDIGWVKIAYTYALSELYALTKYKDQESLTPDVFSRIMREIIERGGDTDTNANIVGALVGSIFGFTKLPPLYLEKVLDLKFKQDSMEMRKTNRPNFFAPRNCLVNILKLQKKFNPK